MCECWIISYRHYEYVYFKITFLQFISSLLSLATWRPVVRNTNK